MIRVILQGRTGNNLFQYAAGRALSHRHHTSLILDGAWSDQVHARQFEHLLRLPLNAHYERRWSLAKRACRKVFGQGPLAHHSGPVLVDPANGSDPGLNQTRDGAVLIGFFQCAHHIGEIERELRTELDLSLVTLPSESLAFEDRLRARPTVSIHVRRGDYLRIGTTHCLGKDYHQRAIDRFRQRFENLRFCVFSDDIPWCRNTFQGDDFLFSDFPAATTDPLHDLRLMSACHHHIVVNSSYSWWGAWLNPKTDKEVIAPKRWMTGLESSSVLPPDWFVI